MENKKFWYIQLNVNFFEDERIDWLCEQKNGYAYVVLYLKLCLKTANNNGILSRQIGDMIIPYHVEKIAEITHMDADVVRVALELYKRIGLIYEADAACNFMRLPDVPDMVGYVTQEGVKKRRQRERRRTPALKEQDNKGDIVGDNSGDKQGDTWGDNLGDTQGDNVPQELRVKSKELIVNSLEIEIEKEKKEPRHRYGEYKNVLLSDRELDKLKQEFPDWEDRIERLSEYMASTGKTYKNHLATIRNWAKRDRERVRSPARSPQGNIFLEILEEEQKGGVYEPE